MHLVRAAGRRGDAVSRGTPPPFSLSSPPPHSLHRQSRSCYEFFREAARRPSQRELRKDWFQNPKYFKTAPLHGYHHKWMPVVSEATGQDIEVDPFSRIGKRGNYAQMLRHWEPWYDLQNLLVARGAPSSELRIALDLAKHNVRLGDDKSAVLLRAAVSKVEALIAQPGFLRKADTLRRSLQDAKLLTDTLEASHTVSLETGAALISLYSLGGQTDLCDSVEVRLRHLLEDPEAPLLHKKQLYESLSLGALVAGASPLGIGGGGVSSGAGTIPPGGTEGAGRREEVVGRSMRWLSEMKSRGIKPGSEFFEAMLYHLVEAGDLTRALEVRHNMESPDMFGVEMHEGHYHQLLRGCAQKGEVELFSALQLDMKRDKIPYSTGLVWTYFIQASASRGDVQHLIGAWEALKSVRLNKTCRSPRYSRRRRAPKISKAFNKIFRHTTTTALLLLSTLQSKGRMRDTGYPLWRKETLLPGGALRGSPWFIKRGTPHHTGVSQRIVLPVLNGLISEGGFSEAAELYDEILPKFLGNRGGDPGESANRAYLEAMAAGHGEKPGGGGAFGRRAATLRISDARVWHRCSIALAKVGRLSESLFAASLMADCRKKPRQAELIGASHYLHIIDAAMLLSDPGLRDYYIKTTLDCLSIERIPRTPEVYCALSSALITSGDHRAALQAYSEMLSLPPPSSTPGTPPGVSETQQGVGSVGNALLLDRISGFLSVIPPLGLRSGGVAGASRHIPSGKSGVGRQAGGGLHEAPETSPPPPSAIYSYRKVVESLWDHLAFAADGGRGVDGGRAPLALPTPLVAKFAETHPDLPGLSEKALEGIPGFADYFGDGGLLPVQPPLMDSLLAAGGQGCAPKAFIADGTVAGQIEGFISGMDDRSAVVAVPFSVLAQLHAAEGRPDATEDEKRFFAVSLANFRMLSAGGGGGGACKVILLGEESRLGVSHAPPTHTPSQVVQIAHSLGAALRGVGGSAAVLTNDTEMAAFCTARGVPVHVLNRHSRAMLQIESAYTPMLPKGGEDAPLAVP